MKTLINSEYVFTKTLPDKKQIGLTVYVNHLKKTYDIVQNYQEGIMPKENNTETKINRAYFELALEALDFLDSELFNN